MYYMVFCGLNSDSTSHTPPQLTEWISSLDITQVASAYRRGSLRHMTSVFGHQFPLRKIQESSSSNRLCRKIIIIIIMCHKYEQFAQIHLKYAFWSAIFTFYRLSDHWEKEKDFCKVYVLPGGCILGMKMCHSNSLFPESLPVICPHSSLPRAQAPFTWDCFLSTLDCANLLFSAHCWC